MQTLNRLKYLASRLARIDDQECKQAWAILIEAIDKYGSVEHSSPSEHDLYHAVWVHITRTLDYAEYPSEYEAELDAMEGEVAGRVLGIRLAQGTLTQPVKDVARKSLLSRIRAFGSSLN